MKRFTITLDDGSVFTAVGTELKEVEGWDGKVPDFWIKHFDKIVEEDISDEIAEQKSQEQKMQEAMSLIANNLPKLKELLEVE